MIYGFENEEFYLDMPSCSRPVGNLKEETERRALDLSKQYSNLVLSHSSGIDSQIVLRAFLDQGLPIKTVFMHTPGYNDYERSNLNIIDSRLGTKTEVVEINIDNIKIKLIEESIDTGIHVYSLLWKYFLEQVPKDWNLIQMTHDPYIHSTKSLEGWYYYMSYNGPEISRERAFNLVNREGNVIYFGDTSEYLLSILTEDALVGCLYSLRYVSNNGLVKEGTSLQTFDRWDYYIKPAIYGKYWKDRLTYFSKFVGFEKADWLNPASGVWEKGVYIPYKDLVTHLSSCDGTVKRFSGQLPVGLE